MSEQELREGLLAAVGDEPALSFDPDALMDRARREVKRRRALFGAGTATVAVAVAAVGVPAMLGMSRVGNTAGGGGPGPGGCPSVSVPVPTDPADPAGPPETVLPTLLPSASYKFTAPAPPPGSPTTTHRPSGRPSNPPDVTPLPPTSPAHPCASAPSERPPSPVPPTASSGKPPAANFPWPPPGAVKRQYTAAQLKTRGAQMQKHLNDSFGKIVVGATAVGTQEFSGEAAGAVSDGQTYLDSFVVYTLNGGRTAVGISVYSPGNGPPPDQECEGGCSVQELSAGDHLVISTIKPGPALEIVSVSHYRADGSVVRASGYNYDPTGKSMTKTLPAMPVTVDQLTALATDPTLGI